MLLGIQLTQDQPVTGKATGRGPVPTQIFGISDRVAGRGALLLCQPVQKLCGRVGDGGDNRFAGRRRASSRVGGHWCFGAALLKSFVGGGRAGRRQQPNPADHPGVQQLPALKLVI